MIKAIAFDFDGVVYLEQPKFSELLSKKFNIPLNQILIFFQNELVHCQLGRADLQQELSRYIKKWKINTTVEQLIDLWFDHGGVNNKITKLIKELKTKGFQCILATTNERYRMNYMISKYNLDKLFDAIIPSYQVRARKPDLKFYSYLLKNINLKAEEVLIIDDNHKFKKINEKLAFKTIIFKSNQQLKKELSSLPRLKK